MKKGKKSFDSLLHMELRIIGSRQIAYYNVCTMILLLVQQNRGVVLRNPRVHPRTALRRSFVQSLQCLLLCLLLPDFEEKAPR